MLSQVWRDSTKLHCVLEAAGARGAALADEAALAVDTVHKAATTAKATAISRLLGLVMSLFIVPPTFWSCPGTRPRPGHLKRTGPGIRHTRVEATLHGLGRPSPVANP